MKQTKLTVNRLNKLYDQAIQVAYLMFLKFVDNKISFTDFEQKVINKNIQI